MTQAIILCIWNIILAHRIRRLKNIHMQNILLINAQSLLTHRI
uniref:Uncharacterized protein n=1 Tax=virus sp. ctx9V1 TaxID=2828001 RepID=A0A8S5RDH2_9VIRU|nr:MAG TPA: hypothetical protein [virus sp. ctx9V1]